MKCHSNHWVMHSWHHCFVYALLETHSHGRCYSLEEYSEFGLKFVNYSSQEVLHTQREVSSKKGWIKEGIFKDLLYSLIPIKEDERRFCFISSKFLLEKWNKKCTIASLHFSIFSRVRFWATVVIIVWFIVNIGTGWYLRPIDLTADQLFHLVWPQTIPQFWMNKSKCWNKLFWGCT